MRWALHKRKVLGEVRPVAAYQLPVLVGAPAGLGRRFDARLCRAEAQSTLDTALATVALDDRDEAGGLAERARVVEGHPGVVLVDAAADADLLVVGTRGRNPMATILLGSVSEYCVRRSPVPVAVIPPAAPPESPLQEIVVGVDGSEHSARALGWALDHIEPTGTVRAVGALSPWGYVGEAPDPSSPALEEWIGNTVERIVNDVIRGRPAGPIVDIVVIGKDARVALRDATAPSTDLLVVGTRGQSGLSHLLLGSISTALVHHPTVPTVVVPGPGESSRQGEV